jgi:hypothetical protein
LGESAWREVRRELEVRLVRRAAPEPSAAVERLVRGVDLSAAGVRRAVVAPVARLRDRDALVPVVPVAPLAPVAGPSCAVLRRRDVDVRVREEERRRLAVPSLAVRDGCASTWLAASGPPALTACAVAVV